MDNDKHLVYHDFQLRIKRIQTYKKENLGGLRDIPMKTQDIYEEAKDGVLAKYPNRLLTKLEEDPHKKLMLGTQLYDFVLC